ncbi:unnamed protein product [Brachionus calyciflorus]|uniref:Uncharacterized protein n=1 Tax=Brachionus calyciflorus TaxID=104777 RepID=A0A813WVM9_9BILA|nr:unnamed protein product [Brachionus calyciflorus]
MNYKIRDYERIINSLPLPLRPNTPYSNIKVFVESIKSYCKSISSNKMFKTDLRSSKVIVIGSLGCGKTSLIQRFVSNSFSNDYKSTIGVDFKLAEYWKPFPVVSSYLRYNRNKTKPANPKEPKDILINEAYSKLNDQLFLQFDNHDNRNRILIFMTPIEMKILANSNRWHLDETFKTCPTHFHQILSKYYQN